MEALRKAGKLATGGDARRAIARGVCTIMITISGMPARRVTALEELTPRRTWAGMEIMRASEMDGTRYAWPAAAIGKFPSRELGPPHGRHG